MIQIKLKYTRQRIEDPNLHIAWNDIVGDISGNTALQDALNNKQDVGDYATQNDLSAVEDSLQNTINQTKDDINGELDKKANKSDVYTKEDADSRFQSVGDYALKSDLPDLGPYAKTIDVDSKLSNEATLRNKADQYISGVVTSNKADVERKLAGKLDATAYTPYNDAQIKQDIAKKADKTYVDSELAKKQDKGDYVSATTLNDYALKTDIPNTSEFITSAYTYDKATIDSSLGNKADKNHSHDIDDVTYKDYNFHSYNYSGENVKYNWDYYNSIFYFATSTLGYETINQNTSITLYFDLNKTKYIKLEPEEITGFLTWVVTDYTYQYFGSSSPYFPEGVECDGTEIRFTNYSGTIYYVKVENYEGKIGYVSIGNAHLSSKFNQVKNSLTNLIDEKANSTDVYTKTEIDNMVGNINNALNQI